MGDRDIELSEVLTLERGRGRGGEASAPYTAAYSDPRVICGRGNLELSREVWTGIFFLSSEIYINFEGKTTFISNIQIYFQKQQALKHSYVS